MTRTLWGCFCWGMLAATAAGAAEPQAAATPDGETVTVDADAVLRYVASCRKPNGAFGPVDQEYTDAAWNMPAVGIHFALGANVEQAAAIVEHGLGAPAGHGGCGHMQFFHHHWTRNFLGRPIKPQHAEVDVYHTGFVRHYYASPYGTENDLLYKSGGRPNPDPVDLAAEKFYYHNLSSLHYLLIGLRTSGRTVKVRQPLVDYVLRRQSAGGFGDGGENGGGDAHIAFTMFGVTALHLLGAEAALDADATVAFVESCRDKKTGGYRWNPKLNLPANEVDVYYTWAAIGILNQLKREPVDAAKTIEWLNSLQNADGGFGDRPGWRSRLYSTFYATDALRLLAERTPSATARKARELITVKQVPVAKHEPIPAGEFQVFQAQFKVPILKPDELAGLSRRGLNLLGIKSYDLADAEKLLPAIESQKLPMDVVLCPEMYPHRLVQTGGVTLNHVGNFTLDSRWTAEERAQWQAADAAGRQYPLWPAYRDQVIAPVRRLGGFAYPEQDFEMEYAYLSYDSARDGRGGYNAVLCGFNWPPKDFVRVFPWHERYVDRLTPIADVDAHGDLEKWSPQLDTVRTLFVARGPKFADFQEAAAAGRVVTVIAQPEGAASGASYYGPPAAVEYVKQRRGEWQWWK